MERDFSSIFLHTRKNSPLPTIISLHEYNDDDDNDSEMAARGATKMAAICQNYERVAREKLCLLCCSNVIITRLFSWAILPSLSSLSTAAATNARVFVCVWQQRKEPERLESSFQI
jgi:hypothetical protein